MLGVLHVVITNLTRGLKINAPMEESSLGGKALVVEQLKKVLNFIRNIGALNLDKVREG